MSTVRRPATDYGDPVGRRGAGIWGPTGGGMGEVGGAHSDWKRCRGTTNCPSSSVDLRYAPLLRNAGLEELLEEHAANVNRCAVSSAVT